MCNWAQTIILNEIWKGKWYTLFHPKFENLKKTDFNKFPIKKYSKSSIFCKLSLVIIIKSPPWNPTHQGLFKNIKSASKFLFFSINISLNLNEKNQHSKSLALQNHSMHPYSSIAFQGYQKDARGALCFWPSCDKSKQTTFLP
jgi:hypothetical protein